MPPSTGNNFEVYRLFVEDTAKLSDRRQSMNTIYLSVNSVLLGALALVAQVGGINNPLFVIADVFVAIGGLFIAGRWHVLLNKYRDLGRHRFGVLLNLESQCNLAPEAQMYRLESKEKIYGFTEIEKSLPTMFQVVYVLATVFLIGGVLILHPHFVAQLRQLFPSGR